MTLGRCAVLVAGTLLLVALAPACTQTANVTEVFTALDGEGNRKRNEFFTDTKEIHCIVKAGVGRPGVTVEAFIRQLQAYDFAANKYVPVNRVLAYGEEEAPRSKSVQNIDVVLSPGAGQKDTGSTNSGGSGGNDPPFEAGRYQCEVRLDGQEEGEAVFNIDFPPCPPTIIVPGAVCFGFYRENDLCPAGGESGDPDPKCSCSIAEGWKC